MYGTKEMNTDNTELSLWQAQSYGIVYLQQFRKHYFVKGKKVKERIAVNGTLISQLRGVTCHIGSHSVTCHRPALTPANSSRFTYPGGMEGSQSFNH